MINKAPQELKKGLVDILENLIGNNTDIKAVKSKLLYLRDFLDNSCCSKPEDSDGSLKTKASSGIINDLHEVTTSQRLSIEELQSILFEIYTILGVK